ncbi:MAG: hypothetical protein Q9201_007834 [Fulgogasparrea decipioides]
MAGNANARKRAIETVDLTDDGPDQPAFKMPRSSQASSITHSQPNRSAPASSQPTQSQRDSWVEEEDANDTILLSQEGDDGQEDTEEYELYGTLRTKIVGVRYYTGYATIGEYVSVRREPSNPYDGNAIRVSNVMRDQIGHLGRREAAKLARYMDSGSLLIEGSLSGIKGEYDCPIDIRLFGPSDRAKKQELVDQMRRDKLPLDAIVHRAQEEKRKQREELAKLKAAQKSGRVTTSSGRQWEFNSSQTQYSNSQSSGTGEPAQTMDNIIETSQRINPREMGEVVEKFGAGEEALSKMPMADQPPRLATKMLSYQRQGLFWLLAQEDPKLPPVGNTEAVQMWKRNARDPALFTNIATNFSIKNAKPTLASGGILADDMGLGKTLEMISLIVSDPLGEGPTLIVAPLGIMSNWSGQIAHHVRPDQPLKVFTYHGTSKKQTMTAERFAEYDVVITTYGTLSTEHSPKGTKSEPTTLRKDGLFSMIWRRVILDEGHQIRNPTAKSSLACSALSARSRWVLTGTPIINSLKDLYSLVRFLGLTGGLERLEIFNSVLIRPLKQGSDDASLLLQALMGTICLRRKKEMKFIDLRLPELTEYVHRVEFLPHEKEKYEALQAEAKGLLRVAKTKEGTSKGSETYRHLLEILLRLRQVCNHWKLCGERVTSLLAALETSKVIELTPGNRKALQDMLQLSIDSHEDCPVCLEPLHDPVITACAHTFGYGCIERVIETQHRCPMCRAEPLELESLVRPAVDLGESVEADIDIDTSSSKVEALIKILKASRGKEGNKVVIFSQWTSFLNIIQHQLDEQGWKYARIDGSMKANQRDAAMAALSEDPECRIMLASLAVCSVGLNLVAANHVIMADSWWAPSIEVSLLTLTDRERLLIGNMQDQAVDRVHRLGQTKPTTVWRLVVDESIEDRVLDIQAEKRKLMMTAFQEKASKRAGAGKQARLGDIEKLLR